MERLQLPTPYLFTIDTPVLLFNGRLLQPKAHTDDDDNYAEFYGRRFSLEEIVTPGKLEGLYFRHNAEAIERFQQGFVQQYFNQEFSSMESLSEQVRQNRVLSFIIEKILPVITADRMNQRIEDIVTEDQPGRGGDGHSDSPEQAGDVPASVLREVRAIKQRLIGEIEAQYEGIGYESTEEDELSDRINSLLRPTVGGTRHDKFPRLHEDTVISDLLGNNNMMVINGNIYSLLTIRDFIWMFEDGIDARFLGMADRFYATKEPEEIVQTIERNRQYIEHKYLSRIINKIESSKVKVNSKYYVPFLWDRTANFVEGYRSMLEKRMKTDAVEHSEHQTREIYRISQERARLDSIARGQSYEQNNAGFEMVNGEYWVYVKTPPYALKSPHFSGQRVYVPFQPAKIGVRIRACGNGFEVSPPVIMHAYRHPFLGNASAYKGICLGNWHAPGRMNSEQKALTYLNQGKKTLMMGYRSGSNPYIRLHEGEWNTWLTKQQCDSRGLVVLNDFSD